MAAYTLLDKSFTSAGNTIAATGASWNQIGMEGGPGAAGDNTMGEQALRTFVTFNAASGTATLGFAITETDTTSGVNAERVVYYETCAVTGNASRVTTLDNSGTVEYVASAVWTVTGRDTIDLLGHMPQGTKCYIGLVALGTATACRVRVCSTKNAG